MTKFTPTSLPDQETPVRRSPNPVRSVLVVIFRLLLLGIGGGFALLLGIAIAQFFPAKTANAPLLEGIFQQSETALTKIKQLREGSSSPPSPPTSSPAASSAPASPSPGATASPDASTLPPVVTATTSDTEKLAITLPTNALFNSNDDVFRPEAQPILDSIVTDLQRYPEATIQVAAYTDEQPANVSGEPTETAAQQRSQSFAQAQIIKRYLANRVGDQYHWVVAGFGNSQPIVLNDSAVNQQRNRRIQVTIQPQ